MAKYFPKIIGDAVYLSPMSLDDLEQYTRWLNDLEMTKYLGAAATTISLEKEREALEMLAKGEHNFAIVLKGEDRLLGNISLMKVNHLHQTAEVGLFIGNKEDRGKGYGSEALRLIVDFGFKYLNLKNIMLKVNAENKAAIAAYKKCGFNEFGRRTRSVYVDGKWCDDIYMEVLREW